MNICKRTLKEINIYGTAVTTVNGDVTAHLEVCDSCAAAFREAAALENCLLSVNDLEAPVNLKYSVLAAVKDRQSKRPVIPALRFVLKATGVFALAVSGIWLGLQAANGGNTPAPERFDITKAAPYSLNTEPLSPASLGEIYFSVMKEGINAK